MKLIINEHIRYPIVNVHIIDLIINVQSNILYHENVFLYFFDIKIVFNKMNYISSDYIFIVFINFEYVIVSSK